MSVLNNIALENLASLGMGDTELRAIFEPESLPDLHEYAENPDLTGQFELEGGNIHGPAFPAKHAGGRPQKSLTYLGPKRLARVKAYFRYGCCGAKLGDRQVCAPGLHWYDDVRSEIHKLFGADRGDLFILFLAATSPLRNIKSNVQLALKAMRIYENQVPLSGFMKSHKDNLIRAGLHQELSGLKVASFARALLGDPNAVTVDRWMMRAFDYDHDSPSAPEYRFIEGKSRALAFNENVEPRQFQAAVWTGIKCDQSDLNVDPVDPFPVLLRKYMFTGQGQFDFLHADETLNETYGPMTDELGLELNAVFDDALESEGLPV